MMGKEQGVTRRIDVPYSGGAMKVILAVLSIATALATPAAAEDAYLDDRSSAESVVRSLYNAINRHELARAYDYFDPAPSKDFAAFAKGFEDTDRVDVLTGVVSADGAAGSVFYGVPTAIRAKDAKGNMSYFAGCYTVRAVNGAIQEPPSRPYRIQQAKLKPITEGDYTVYSLPKCSEAGDETQAEANVEAAKARFVSDMAGQCDKTAETLGGLNEPEAHVISYKPAYASASDPETKVTLFVFACSMAAYNSSEVYYLFDGVSGLHRLSFATPHLAISYVDEDGEHAKLKSMKVDGLSSSEMLTNSEFDPATNSISEFAKWRGIGDASSNGTWAFVDGQYVLKTYDVDPTYDGETEAIEVMKDGVLLPLK
jgi:hypothetical protein